MAYRKWTDQDLINAVKTSNTKTDVLKKLNLSIRSGNFQTIDNHIKRLNLNKEHFLENKNHPHNKKKNLSDFLVENCLSYNSSNLKRQLLKTNLLKNECHKCHSLPLWQNSPLVLHLDHINGNRTDNRLENLRLLCPNCHSQTETYCRGHKRKKITNCLECNKQITNKYSFCHTCAINKNKKFKIAWPSTTDLIRMVRTLGFSATGKYLKVTDNSVRKRLKKLLNKSEFDALIS